MKLSADAKSFVPENFALPVPQYSVNQHQHCEMLGLSHVPCYMTTCYPFVNNDYSVNLQWVTACYFCTL